MIFNQKVKKNQQKQNNKKTKATILLVDEVDVFFNDSYYGK